MKKKLAASLVTGALLLLLPYLYGQCCSPTLMMTVTPNPNGQPQTIQGSGTWTLPAGYTFTSIQFSVTLQVQPPQQPQRTSGQATVNGANWTSTLQVVAGTYTCQAVMYYKDNNGVDHQQTSNWPNKVTVK